MWTDKQTVLKGAHKLINMSGITLHYTPVRRGFTQRGTVRSVTTVFTLYFETDQSEPLLGRLDTCTHAQFSSTTSRSPLGVQHYCAVP